MTGTRRWGLSESEWGEAAARLRELLAGVALRRSTVTYGEAARVAFAGRFSARSGALMDLLGEVDEAELAERGIIIATLVVRADTGRPGDGYFAFLEREVGESPLDREGLWCLEAERVWAAYGSVGAE